MPRKLWLASPPIEDSPVSLASSFKIQTVTVRASCYSPYLYNHPISGSGGYQVPVQEQKDDSKYEEVNNGVQTEQGVKENEEAGSISQVGEPRCVTNINGDGSNGEVSNASEAQFTDGAPLTSPLNQSGGNEALRSEAGVGKHEGRSRTHWSDTGRGVGAEPKPISSVDQRHIAWDGSDDEAQASDGVSMTSQPNQINENEGYDSKASVGERASGSQPNGPDADEQERADQASLSPAGQANAPDESSADGTRIADEASEILQLNQSCEDKMSHFEEPT